MRTSATSRSGAASTTALGAPLARLESKIAFEVLLERFDDIQVGRTAPQYKQNIVLRGIKQFPIRVQRRSAVEAAAAGS